MKKIILVSLIFIISRVLNAQTFPYLNASTGNEGQYIVDSDTNIIMFHDNQIEKLDKNFNPIWVKTYSGLNFYSLLLSKTGSIYFIASGTTNPYLKNFIGKLNFDGSLSWCKLYQSSAPSNQEKFCQLMLDRNNNLVVSGNANLTSLPCSNAWFLKLDTLGNVLSSKRFEVGGGFCFEKFVIVEDNQGIYRFIGNYSFFETGGIMVFKYNEINDSITSNGFPATIGQFQSINATRFSRSKYDTSVYYSMHSGQGLIGNIIKYKKDSIIWKTGFNISNWAYFIDGFDEDNLQNIIYTISTPYQMNYAFENIGVKINSNCTHLKKVQYFNNFYFAPPNLSHISGKIHFLYDNFYLYSLSGSNFGALTTTPIDSNLNSSCATGTTYSISNISSGNFMSINTFPTQIINDITTYSNLTPTVSSITNFSINANYCLLTSTQEIKKEPAYLSIQPNPANNILNIITSSIINEATVFDLIGKKIISIKYTNTIDVSSLTKGLYIINIKTDEVDISQKFIKD